MRKLIVGYVISLATLSGCATMHPAPKSNVEAVKIWHVVIVRLNQPGDANARQKLIEATHALRQIHGVQVAYAGTSIPGNRPHIDSSFDVGIVIGFANKEDMANYVTDPIHQRTVNEVLKPLAKDYTIFDFTND